MYQTVALLGDIAAGLPGHHHPGGGIVYAIRDDQEFLYIGKTIKGRVWPHIRQHLRLDGSVGRAARDAAPASTNWRVEVCIFVGEWRVNLVEGELIRRYRPRLNWTYNRRRPLSAFAYWQLQKRSAIGPSCLAVIDHGWPDFNGIAREILE